MKKTIQTINALANEEFDNRYAKDIEDETAKKFARASFIVIVYALFPFFYLKHKLTKSTS